MNVTEAINENQNFVDNTGSSQADQAQRRLRHLSILREVVNFVRYYRDWAFVRTSATLVVPIAGYEKLPTDFLNFGKYGGVWNPSDNGRKLGWVSEDVISRARAEAVTVGTLEVYSIFGIDPTTSLQLIQLPPTGAAVTLSLAYMTKTPLLNEDATPVTGGRDNLVKAIPEEYHYSVILPGMRAKGRESKGDSRWQNADRDFENGLKGMLRTCRRSQGTLGQLPSFFRR